MSSVSTVNDNVEALNNQGIDHLRRKEWDSAALSFRSALLELSNCFFAPGSFKLETLKVLDAGARMDTDHNVMIPFTSAYCITRVPEEAGQAYAAGGDACSSQNTAAVGILFNTGLAMHMKATTATPLAQSRQEQQQERALTQAVKVYQMATNAALRQPRLCQAESRLLAEMLLALSNNQAHLAFHKFEWGLLQQHVENLRYYLQFYQDPADWTQAQFFIFNALLCEKQTERSAAAA